MSIASKYRTLIKESLKPVYKYQKNIVRDKNGKIVSITINNSLLSHMFFTSNHYEKNTLSDYCPKQLHLLITGQDYMIPNVYMERGLYFESKILGSTANSKEYILPKTANGKTSTAEVRINEQIDMFPMICDKYGVIVSDINTQVDKTVQLESYGDIQIFMKVKADLISPITIDGEDIEAAVIDFKLTGNIETGYWSNYIDFTQGVIYSLVFNLPFYYWIFDYSPSLQNSLRRLITSGFTKNDEEKNEASIRKIELFEKIRKAIEMILMHEHEGYVENPSEKSCKQCPLNPDNGGLCQKATKISVI